MGVKVNIFLVGVFIVALAAPGFCHLFLDRHNNWFNFLWSPGYFIGLLVVFFLFLGVANCLEGRDTNYLRRNKTHLVRFNLATTQGSVDNPIAPSAPPYPYLPSSSRPILKNTNNSHKSISFATPHEWNNLVIPTSKKPQFKYQNNIQRTSTD